jgi:hypothetical protein
MHYADPKRWSELLGKQQGKGGTSTNIFWNEVLGESDETAAKLVTLTELDAVSNLGPNTMEHARSLFSRYKTRVLAVDWGGGGEKKISFTVAALVCMTYDGKIEVPWAKRLLTASDHLKEAAEIKFYWDYFRPHYLAHDYTGAGSLRETFMIQAGVPEYHIFAAQYIPPCRGAPVFHVGADEEHPRDYYRVDRNRTLLVTCGMVKVQGIHFFDRDYESPEDPGLLRDFLSLFEEKIKTMRAGEIYKIDRMEGFSDDFAQAVNIGCCSMWYKSGTWPNLAELTNYVPTVEQVEAITGSGQWEEPV